MSYEAKETIKLKRAKILTNYTNDTWENGWIHRFISEDSTIRAVVELEKDHTFLTVTLYQMRLLG